MAPMNFGKFFKAPSATERMDLLGVRSDVGAVAATMATGLHSDGTVDQISHLLPEAEFALAMIEGRFQKMRGLLVLTSDRVFFMAHQSTGDLLFTIPLTTLNSTAATVQGTRLELPTPKGPVTVDQTLGRSAANFAEALDRQLHGPQIPVNRDPLELLAEIRALHESGVMTDAEFAAEKHRLMDQI